jgi:MoaA/NifB/PqqE/SkfB family radical SAM enzyme
MLNPANPAAMQEVIRIAVQYKANTIKFIHPMFASEQDITAHRHFLSHNLGRGINYWQGAQSVVQEQPDIKKIQQVCSDLQREKALHIETFPSFNETQLRYYYTMDDRFPVSYRGNCHAMWSTATLLPLGEVESCPDYIAGNCTMNPIMEIWNNSLMQALRRRIHHKRFFAVCRACCFYYM